MGTPDALKTYKAKRNFSITTEPSEGGVANTGLNSHLSYRSTGPAGCTTTFGSNSMAR